MITSKVIYIKKLLLNLGFTFIIKKIMAAYYIIEYFINS